MSENERLIPWQRLQTFIGELFTAGGLSAGEAAWFAQTVVQANLWGLDSHGVVRVPTYFARIRSRAINPDPHIRTIRKAPAVTLIDGDGAAGSTVGRIAMEQAIADARVHGVGLAGAANSNHFGAAWMYTRMAVEQGMAGVAIANVKPIVAAPGARAAVVGTNPLSIAIPTYCSFPFALDMALSMVAGGKLHLAAARGEKIPYGWGVDREGMPTDDPKKALEGFLLPMGGYKGLGLAYAIDILCGVITGGPFADEMRSMYQQPDQPSLTGHMMLAIDLSAWIEPEQMRRRMERYHEFIRSVPLAEGAQPLVFPGEIETEREKIRRVEGVPVPLSTLETLLRLREEHGVRAAL